MEKKRWGHRILRQLFNCIPASRLTSRSSWHWLMHYPAVTPAPICFNEWNQADDRHPDYQKWINQHGLTTLGDWRLLQKQAYQWQAPPKFTIVTPVHNTQVEVLYECILSVRAQAYPYWQLILVDDGSSSEATHKLLKSGICRDPRIKVCACEQSQGISNASNLAIEHAQGDYIVFLDHDDRLSLDALYWLAAEIRYYQHKVDILYSDRDMISPEGKRYMHLFKPDWSPESLLAGNYIFHLMCYSKLFLQQLGGYRPEFDGSQDYDLILRASEAQPRVRHIQKVLYHWRQYQGSVSLDSEAKDYAFKAGVNALNQALQRRSISGEASEIKGLWRGNYQLDLVCPEIQDIDVVNIDANLPIDAYVSLINQSVQKTGLQKPFIALISRALTPVKANAIATLAAWLKMEGVGLASGSIISESHLIEYAGATFQQNGGLLVPYQGCPDTEAGYMAVTRLVRNISAPHPFCVVIRRELWQQLKGLNEQYNSYYALLGFALKAEVLGWRCISVPQAQFRNTQKDLLTQFSEQDKQLFATRWKGWLDQGDPFYNNNLDRKGQDKQYYISVNEN